MNECDHKIAIRKGYDSICVLHQSENGNSEDESMKYNLNDYDYEFFVYCPDCGKKLDEQ